MNSQKLRVELFEKSAKYDVTSSKLGENIFLKKGHLRSGERRIISKSGTVQRIVAQ